MSLSVVCGPMFSGKTSHMLQEITKYSDISTQRHALIINHTLDTRDPTKVVSSHNSMYKGLSDKIDVVSASNLNDIDVSKYNIIGVDEANFFGDLVETVKSWVKDGKHVICSGLDSDYRMEKFGNISDLVHYSDKFVKLSAICSLCLAELEGHISPCNTTPAPFTMKLPGMGDDIVDIGGSDKYVPVCRFHHNFSS